jgi:hypothetical protein
VNPTNPFWRTLTACACLAVPLMAHTQASAQTATPSPVQAKTEPVGFVKTVTGQAWVNTSGQSVAAQPGTPVLLGSQLKTAKGAAMGIAFKDNTLMSFGPDTELTVDEFVYAPAQGQLLLGTRLSRGSLNYVSGVIAKLRPDAVTVKTPAGIIGVRGTQFVARVEEAQ